tara:strand:+ start:53 stop:238 length:186 start_codon:yes stop_codon:yes gene_type:complete
MTKYEVRTTQTIVKYYHVKANSSDAAIKAIKNDEGILDDMKILEKKYDYALQLSPEGEPIL